MYNKTIKELSILLKKKKISITELTILFLKKIYKNNINAFININEELTLKQAKIAEKKFFNKENTILTGIPIAHKDVFVTKGWKTTAGSKILKNYISPFDAFIIKKLNFEGMITLGKLNCDEFAMGSSNENSFFGPVKNPWDKKAVSGGSSGGSAAAVAARLTPVATATDTGGSIRQPSSFCGVTGIKPTYGSVSRFGIISFASSLDQAGIIAKNAEDCALLLNSIICKDKSDLTNIKRPKENFYKNLNCNLQNIKIGIPKEFFNQNISEDIKINIENALNEFKKLGANLINIKLYKTELYIPTYYIISSAEAYSNLSRFDGIRFGIKHKKYKNIIKMYKKYRSDNFGNEVKLRILIGSHILSDNFYNKCYLQAQKIRRIITNELKEIFNKKNKNYCDVIIGPVSPTVAWNIKEKKRNPILNYISDILTLPSSLSGLPSISIPCGFSKYKTNKNRPIGLQIIGNYFNESKILNLAYKFQQVTDWHTKIP
ncbi:Asp-tRNA(Asn)/Glu-tRNA(Gln) amidotransferase subunit GatA [Candidatus Zinderia endosymbiont of Aphrophora alni]|uniref:Asp-tRNA(Asn)/Glu-tRNA(Gln) amidotransferase subunit GatA n=1 Tax=Candidatus Zinderia endosymbiont of Aphrophora alni TaxID=3077951 RepID=UPI0030CD4343